MKLDKVVFYFDVGMVVFSQDKDRLRARTYDSHGRHLQTHVPGTRQPISKTCAAQLLKKSLNPSE